MEHKKYIYQLALSSPGGVSPQKNEVFKTEREAKKRADLYNLQNSNPYCEWIVVKHEVISLGNPYVR